MRTTRPARAHSSALVRPAMPLPSTRKSLSTGTDGRELSAPVRPGQAFDRNGARIRLLSSRPSPIVTGMRVAVWGASVALAFATTARADIYSYRDRTGAIVFTNAPV